VILRAAPGGELALVVVLPVPFTPTRKVTSAASEARDFALRSAQDGDHLLLEQRAQLVAALNVLAQCTFAERIEDGGGGLEADVAREQRDSRARSPVHRPHE